MNDQDEKTWFLPGKNAAEGRLVAPPSNRTASLPMIEISARTVVSIIRAFGLEKLALLKIDVEGHEEKVLRGAEQTTNKFRSYFLIDLHTPKQDVLVANWLVHQRYHISRLFGPPIYRTDVGWPNPEGVWGSIFATPKKL